MLNPVSFIDLESWIARVYQGQRVLIKPWFLNSSFNVADGAEETKTIKVNSNADFIITGLRAVSPSASAPGKKLQIVDNGSLERFFAKPVDFFSVFNSCYYVSGNTCGTWNNYRRVSGNSSLNVTLTNSDPFGVTFNAAFSLVGVLVYPYSKA